MILNTALRMRSLFNSKMTFSLQKYSSQLNSTKNPYQIAFERSVNPLTREDYWREQTHFVDWFKKPDVILDKSNPNPGFWRWFKDSQVNMCYNAVDRHVQQLHDKPALHWVSPYEKIERTYTWAELQDNVARLAGVYQNLGVKKGDRVVIYMPMVPEAVFGMLACARLGAIHSVVFGGFAAKELASRIKDSEPALILGGSFGYEPGKVINYKKILDEAIDIAGAQNTKVLVYQRDEKNKCTMVPGRDYDYKEMITRAQKADCVPVEGDHPLYILYTSGTTGQPKGIVRDTAGTCVAAQWAMKHIVDIHKGDVYFSGSDIGWVVGHQFIVYGPLLRGATTILHEGKPTGTPDAGQYWRIIEKYRVKGLYTAPTAMRAIRKEDLNGEWIKKFDLSSLTNVALAGERCDVPTYEWIHKHVPGLINDNYWQTETGWVISGNFQNLHTFPIKPGTACKPVPGFDVHILDEHNQEIKNPNKLGRICIKLPMPPSFMLTLYNNDAAFEQKYLHDSPGYYLAGDSGYFDEDGYLNVMARIDDVINTAGHRLSTGSMEEALLKHDNIVEAAVVAKHCDFKGEIPFGFVVPKDSQRVDIQVFEKECVSLIRKEIGPVASFKNCIVVDKLPKTRSGKILRNTLKKIVDGKQIDRIPPTIEDDTVIPKIQSDVQSYFNQN
ncbi:hypothetical protein ABPG73_022341 [Tetrahymena malaccensis]